MNSTAAIKAFTGRHGGTICTSSNARTALQWAFEQTAGSSGAARCSSCPTSTSGATPRSASWGWRSSDCVLYDPHKPVRRADAASSCKTPG